MVESGTVWPPMLPLYIITIFTGAGLLFLVQPMTARLMLPMLGGGPAVWTTCMLFFQTLLLAGYLYAHLLTSRLRLGWQVGVHAVVLTSALTAAALVSPPESAPAPGEWPVPWLLGALLTTVGPAFFAVSTAGPLLQRWFSGIGHRRSANPYFLYAASNAGSLLGLLAYPFVVEPALGLSEQRGVWTVGFGWFVAMAVACGVAAVVLGGRGRVAGAAVIEEPAPRVTWRQRGRWVFLAFVPSSLMIGVTSYLSTDIAVFPLLWVIPLGLYLLSFMVAFGRFGARMAGWLRVPAAVTLIVLVTAYVGASLGIKPPALPLLAVHLAGFAVVATWVHSTLAASAPPAGRLTDFYLMLSVGGALGGLFNAVIAPQIFLLPVEYTLVLAAAGMTLPWRTGRRWVRVCLFLLPVGLYLTESVVISLVSGVEAWPRWFRATLMLLAPAIFPALAYRHGLAFALTLALSVVSSTALLARRDGLIYVERSFYGTIRVDQKTYREHALHSLYHGSTLHGSQVISDREELRRTPLSYYSHVGPVGDVMRSLTDRADGPVTVAVVGLGAGAMAAYLRPGDRLTFYEIDPAMLRVASDPDLFRYLADARGEVRVVLGDGRRELEARRDGPWYDLIVLDAFSSDSIPVHLLTTEAFEMYTRRLKPDGALLVHVSNRYLVLNPIVANAAGAMNALAQGWFSRPTPEQHEQGAVAADWMLVTPAGHRQLPLPDYWGWAHPDPAYPTWTDDYSDVVSTIPWWR